MASQRLERGFQGFEFETAVSPELAALGDYSSATDNLEEATAEPGRLLGLRKIVWYSEGHLPPKRSSKREMYARYMIGPTRSTACMASL